MKLALKRLEMSPRSTMGRLTVDGYAFCWVLEDVVRPGPKVPGETAIPAGSYEVQLTFSNRFQRVMPQLMNVPGFTGIRIHAGNTAKETDGCLLVGFGHAPDTVTQSRMAFDALFGLLDGAKRRGEALSIEISNPPMKGTP